MTPEQMKELAARIDNLALGFGDINEATDLIRQMAEQKPVAWKRGKQSDSNGVLLWWPPESYGYDPAEFAPLYAAPPVPQPARVPMTWAEMQELVASKCGRPMSLSDPVLIGAVERHHGIRSKE
jgi:hypothetical protein